MCYNMPRGVFPFLVTIFRMAGPTTGHMQNEIKSYWKSLVLRIGKLPMLKSVKIPERKN